MAHDTDSFNRWEAGQKLAKRVILENVESFKTAGKGKEIPKILIEAFKKSLNDKDSDKSLIAYALALPDESTISQEFEVVDPDAIRNARNHIRQTLGKILATEFERTYKELTDQEPAAYEFHTKEVARRRLRNLCLGYICANGGQEAAELAFSHFTKAKCMTDKVSGLIQLVNIPSKERDASLKQVR